MRYGSVCSGVEAATLAWEPMGWKAAFFSEIEKFPSEVLRQRWPNVPNLGDLLRLTPRIIMEKLTYSLAELPASLSVWPDLEKALKTVEAISVSNSQNSLLKLKPGGSCGKMSRGYYQATAEKILPAFYLSCQDGKLKSQPHISEKAANTSNVGSDPELSLPGLMDSGWRGECWTFNTCEWTDIHGLFLKEDGVSSLLDILEIGDVPPQYYLTVRACQGILRRSAKRGKILPDQLKSALEYVVKNQ